MRISTRSQYGLRAMCYLTKSFKKEEVFSLKEIAESKNIPQDYLEKIMGDLRKNGLVNSKKGAGGGYSLAKDPKEISVKKILDSLGETEGLVECLRKGKNKCENRKECVVKKVWEKLEESLYRTLKSIKLSDL